MNATNSPSGDPAGNDVGAPEPEDQHRAETEEERHAREEESLQHDQPAVAVQVLEVGAAKAVDLGLLLTVRPHDPYAGERFLGDGADFRQLRLDRLEPLVDGAAEELDRQRRRTAEESTRTG